MFRMVLRMADDLMWMMYPSLCAACGRPLFKGEESLCTPCRFQLPLTGFHREADNPLIKHFWGKANVKFATAYYYFSKGEKVQRLIHQLKYKGRKDVGKLVGKLMGFDLRHSPFQDVDLILPVPLHKKKLKARGYNQSDCFAEGLSIGLNKPFSTNSLIRSELTSTQTQKHRFDRFENVKDVFDVINPGNVAGKKVLLVDDVVTTGSTLLSCAEPILKLPDTVVMIAAIACA